jgi:hypothetical protein
MHSLLYWDAVGAIIPERFVDEPERLGESTRALLREELVLNAFPASAHWGFVSAFMEYLSSLDPGGSRKVRLRVNGEVQLTQLRQMVFEDLLPIPAYCVGRGPMRIKARVTQIWAFCVPAVVSVIRDGMCPLAGQR